MPVDGGATQPAILPGSVTPTISDFTCARSASVGSQSATDENQSSSRDEPAVGGDVVAAEVTHVAVEPDVGQLDLEVDAGLGHGPIPAVDALLAVLDVVVAQRLVEGGQFRDLLLDDALVGHLRHEPGGRLQDVIVVAALLLEAALEAGGEVVGGVGRRLGAEQVERHRVVEVEVLLQEVEVDAAVGVDVVGVVLAHQLDGALDHPTDAGGAHEHVVGLLLQHELAGAGERIERRFPAARPAGTCRRGR